MEAIIGALSLQLQLLIWCANFISNKLNTTKILLATIYFFSSENKNLFKNLNTGFVQVVENLESQGIEEFYFPGLERVRTKYGVGHGVGVVNFLKKRKKFQ